MNILYINHYAGSLEMGMEFRTYYLSKEWVKAGHKVRILAANYSHLRRKNPDVKNDFDIEIIDGIEYQWFKTKPYEGNGLSRALTMFTFVNKITKGAKRIVKEFKPDVVITSSTYPLDSKAGIKIAKLAKCKYVHEVHDLWPLTLTEIGGMSKANPFVVLLSRAEKRAYKKADEIVALLPYTNEHIASLGIDVSKKYTNIPNGISLDDWKEKMPLPEEHQKLFDKLHKEHKFTVLYVGGHALSNYLDVLVDAAKETKDEKDIAYVLVGKGVEKERLMNRCKDEKLDNVYFLPPVVKQCVPEVLTHADALFVAAAKSSLYRYGISMNKIYDYMMAAKPILYGIEAKNDDVKDANCGVHFKPDDISSFVDAIYSLKAMNKDELVKMGQNGQKWVKANCEYSVLANKFIKVIERIKK